MTRAATPLFRPEALAAERPGLSGEIVIARPLSLQALAAAAVLVAAVTVSFVCFGRYADHVTVTGMLVPDRGVIDVRGAQAGRITARFADEGDAVAAGQRLFAISSERESALGPTGRQTRAALEAQLRSLEAQRAALDELERREWRALAASASAFDAEQAKLRAMIAAQRERVTLAAAAAKRYAQMQSHGFVSLEQRQARHEQLLDQRARLQTLERELIATRRHGAEIEAQRESLPARYRNERAAVEQALAATRRERGEAEAARAHLVVAPLAGTITAVLGEVGQAVDGRVALASLLPADAVLEAHLFVPSRAIGFVAAGDPVRLRYRAFPYERFGHHDGRIVSVSQAALAAHELAGGRLAGSVLGAGPYYRVTVRLASQRLPIAAARAPLRPGMLLDAELTEQSRRLYEWILDPYRKLGLGP